jgi:hypothetical protein
MKFKRPELADGIAASEVGLSPGLGISAATAGTISSSTTSSGS